MKQIQKRIKFSHMHIDSGKGHKVKQPHHKILDKAVGHAVSNFTRNMATPPHNNQPNSSNYLEF